MFFTVCARRRMIRLASVRWRGRKRGEAEGHAGRSSHTGYCHGRRTSLIVITGATATGGTALSDRAGRVDRRGLAGQQDDLSGLAPGVPPAWTSARAERPPPPQNSTRNRMHALDLVETDQPFQRSPTSCASRRRSFAGIAARDGVANLSQAEPGLSAGPWRTASMPTRCPATPTSARTIQSKDLSTPTGSRRSSHASIHSRRAFAAVHRPARPAARRSRPQDDQVPGSMPRASPAPWVHGPRRMRFGLSVEPTEHRRRMDDRTRAQFDAGHVEEAEARCGPGSTVSLRPFFVHRLPAKAFQAVHRRRT